jgi:DNA-binding transcriptional MerR regulator
MAKSRRSYNHGVATKAREPGAALETEQFTSMQAARISGVPFYTVDYWDRSRFLKPTVARGDGRGRGRERMYSYHDLLRLRIARELRDERVSLETLRRVVDKLGRHARDLVGARYVLVRHQVEVAATADELLAMLRATDRGTFGILLDLREATRAVAEAARKLRAAESRRARIGL